MGRGMSSEYRLGREQRHPDGSAAAGQQLLITGFGSVAGLAVLGAIVPAMFVIITMMIVVIEAFTRFGDDAGGCKRNQPHQEAAFNDPLCSFHICSWAVDDSSVAHAAPGTRPCYSNPCCKRRSYIALGDAGWPAKRLESPGTRINLGRGMTWGLHGDYATAFWGWASQCSLAGATVPWPTRRPAMRRRTCRRTDSSPRSNRRPNRVTTTKWYAVTSTSERRRMYTDIIACRTPERERRNPTACSARR